MNQTREIRRIMSEAKSPRVVRNRGHAPSLEHVDEEFRLIAGDGPNGTDQSFVFNQEAQAIRAYALAKCRGASFEERCREAWNVGDRLREMYAHRDFGAFVAEAARAFGETADQAVVDALATQVVRTKPTGTVRRPAPSEPKPTPSPPATRSAAPPKPRPASKPIPQPDEAVARAARVEQARRDHERAIDFAGDLAAVEAFTTEERKGHTLERACEAAWRAAPAVRTEFGVLEVFVAYHRAKSAGRAHPWRGKAKRPA